MVKIIRKLERNRIGGLLIDIDHPSAYITGICAVGYKI